MMGSFYAREGHRQLARPGAAPAIWRRRRHMCGCVWTLCTPCRQLNAPEGVGNATCDLCLPSGRAGTQAGVAGGSVPVGRRHRWGTPTVAAAASCL